MVMTPEQLIESEGFSHTRMDGRLYFVACADVSHMNTTELQQFIRTVDMISWLAMVSGEFKKNEIE